MHNDQVREVVHVALPLGIGDCHWAVTKLRALSRYHGGAPIITYTGESSFHKSTGYLAVCPQVTEARYSDAAPKNLWEDLATPVPHRDPYWSSLENCRDWCGFDYVCVPNGHLERGEPLSTFWPELEPFGGTEYQYAFQLTPEHHETVRALVGDEPPFIVYLAGVGPNAGFHNNTFTVDHWVEVVRLLNAAGIRPVIPGGNQKDDLRYKEWVTRKLQRAGLSFLDVVGKTSIPEYLALIEQARCWVGFNSGGGIVAAMRQTPTVMLWSNTDYPIAGVHPLVQLHPKMQRSWLTDEQLVTYRTLNFGSPELTPERVVDLALEVAR